MSRRTAGRWIVAGVALACGLHARPSAAQQPDATSGKVEVSVGIAWFGSTDLGSRDATLTGSGGDRFRLFSASSELQRAMGFTAYVGRHLTRVVEAELSASYVSPRLTTNIANDAENAAPTSSSEALRQFTIEGGALFTVPQGAGEHLQPFVTAGGGYLRQLHEGNTLVQTGRVVYVGGGARIRLASRGADARLEELGIRVDLRALLRPGAVSLDGQSHIMPTVAAAWFARF